MNDLILLCFLIRLYFDKLSANGLKINELEDVSIDSKDLNQTKLGPLISYFKKNTYQIFRKDK